MRLRADSFPVAKFLRYQGLVPPETGGWGHHGGGIMDWDKLRIFHAVAERGSLTRAGEVLHLSQSAVSRQIRALEESLGVTLFHRHARGLILTEQGELLFEAARQMVRHLDATAARIRDSEEGISGELRVTSTAGFGTLWLAPRLVRLYDDYPEIMIHLILKERILDLSMREADIAIRMREPYQANLIRKRLMSVRMRLFAAPEYLQKAGVPKSLDDMRGHRLICQHPDAIQVSEGAQLVAAIMARDVGSILHINNYFGVLQGVLNNLGIGILPDYVMNSSPHLVQVLDEVISPELDVFLVYPEELRHSKRIAIFRDFMMDEIARYRQAQQTAIPAAADIGAM